MRRFSIIGATVACSLVATAANADTLHAAEGRTFGFGPMHASVYYTESGAGDRVIATIVAGPESTPVRFIATLLPGQSLTLSAPGPVGTSPVGFRFTREGRDLRVAPLPPPLD